MDKSLFLQQQNAVNDGNIPANFSRSSAGLLRVRTFYDNSRFAKSGRFFSKPSRLVPDQTYTVRELMERAVVNALPQVQRQGYYDDEQTIERLFAKSGIDLSTLDLVELQLYKRELEDYIEMLSKPPEQQSEDKVPLETSPQ